MNVVGLSRFHPWFLRLASPDELLCSLYYGTILMFGWSFVVGNEPAQAEPRITICNTPVWPQIASDYL